MCKRKCVELLLVFPYYVLTFQFYMKTEMIDTEINIPKCLMLKYKEIMKRIATQLLIQ